MLCDVCNKSLSEGEGQRVSARTFRRLFEAGFGIDPTIIETLTAAGMPRDEAIQQLGDHFLKSKSDWLLCPKCAKSAEYALRQDTKIRLDGGHFEVRNFPQELANCTGLIPIPVIIDLVVGEEVGLYWIDRSAFIQELGLVRPFRLFVKCGLYRSRSGPLGWLLFYVPNPESAPQPFASMECHINPAESRHVEMWRRLANQTHWHLTLIGANDVVVDFFEFENNYALDASLNAMQNACRGMLVTDFMNAKAEFCDTYTTADLYEMG